MNSVIPLRRGESAPNVGQKRDLSPPQKKTDAALEGPTEELAKASLDEPAFGEKKPALPAPSPTRPQLTQSTLKAGSARTSRPKQTEDPVRDFAAMASLSPHESSASAVEAAINLMAVCGRDQGLKTVFLDSGAKDANKLYLGSHSQREKLLPPATSTQHQALATAIVGNLSKEDLALKNTRKILTSVAILRPTAKSEADSRASGTRLEGDPKTGFTLSVSPAFGFRFAPPEAIAQIGRFYGNVLRLAGHKDVTIAATTEELAPVKKAILDLLAQASGSETTSKT